MATVKTIRGNNINGVFGEGVEYFKKLVAEQERVDTRAGQCVRHNGPLITQYDKPLERVLFDTVRDCNPFFHLMESLWMLAGREDVKFLTKFNKNMGNFTDDGETYHGAYGYRWRKTFGVDQLDLIVAELKARPNSRRAMLQIWSAEKDLNKESLDIPCNDLVQFEINKGRLNMSVFNRSNDMIWGAYGANVVQFSMLQEYMAARVGVEVGKYWQISTNFHVYTGVFDKYLTHKTQGNPYIRGGIHPFRLVDNPETFDHELDTWFSNPGFVYDRYENKFLNEVASPIYRCWLKHKEKKETKAHSELDMCNATDWRQACREWLHRRYPEPCTVGHSFCEHEG